MRKLHLITYLTFFENPPLFCYKNDLKSLGENRIKYWKNLMSCVNFVKKDKLLNARVVYSLLAYWVFKLRYCFWEECLDRNREGTSCITWYLWRISYSVFADWFTSFYNYACIHSLKMSDKKFGKTLHQLWHVSVYMLIFTNYVFLQAVF